MADPSRQDFGDSLREARERAGVTLRAISTSTKISLLILGALERNDVSRLPGGLFTRALIRSYAREVGLDPEETLQRYLQQFPEAGGDAELRDAGSEGLEGSRRSGRSSVMRTVAWMLPIAAGIVYFTFLGSGFQFAGRPAAEAERTRVSAPPVAPAAPSGGQQAEATPPPPPQALGESAAVPAEPTVVPAVGESAVAPAAAPEAAATVASQAAPGSVRVALAATGPCWVSLRSDGEVVYAGLMQPGDRREFDVSGQVSLTAGDAAALGFAVNGEPGRSLGGPGVVATVRFSAVTFRSVLAVR